MVKGWMIYIILNVLIHRIYTVVEHAHLGHRMYEQFLIIIQLINWMYLCVCVSICVYQYVCQCVFSWRTFI